MNDRNWIVDRIGAPAFEQLAAGLAGSDLHSVLLEVMQRRAASRSPADVLAQYERDPFCAPAIVDLRESVAVDGHLLAAADEFEALGLSPVAPLGATSSVANTGQNRVLSALRMMEVVSDPTNVLALECARRLRANRDAPVHLATCQRVLRTQPVPRLPAYSQHFNLFALASGGREAKDHAFTMDTVAMHIRTMLRALERLEQHGYAFGARRVDILATSERTTVGDRIAASLDVPTARKLLEHAYYSGGLRYQIWVTAPDGCGSSADRWGCIRLAGQARFQPPGGVHRKRRRRSADRLALSQGGASFEAGRRRSYRILKRSNEARRRRTEKTPLGARSARKGGSEIPKTQATEDAGRLRFRDLTPPFAGRRLGASGISVNSVSFVAPFRDPVSP